METYVSHILLPLGSGADSWLDLTGQLYTLDNVSTGSPIAVQSLVGFGGGYFLWTHTFDRGTEGVMKFYRSSSPTNVLCVAFIANENIYTPSRFAPD